jgi:hypothetical protein
MCKVYVLTKTTGDWEDTFTTCECVCLSHSEAFAEKEKRDKLYNSLNLKIEDWWGQIKRYSLIMLMGI